MAKTLTKEERKKYIVMIGKGARTNRISLSNKFLDEKGLQTHDYVDIRTWTKVDKENLEMQDKAN